jgi:hypothetical protein
VIPEDHFIASEDGEVGLLIRPVRVIPDTACRCHDESSDGLDKGIAPESSEDESVKLV